MRRGVAPAVAVAAIALTAWLNGITPATAADDPAAGESTDGLVHCMLPGQVRRMGAFATTVTPRRATRTSPAQCRTAGGEYVEPQDTGAAVKMWLPMANEGLAEAQTTVGELFEQRGNRAMAQSWYEKAAAQGDTRAMLSLAGLLLNTGAAAGGLHSTASLEAFQRAGDLVSKATGGLVAGLALARSEPLRVDFVSPVGATPLPQTSREKLVVEHPGGALDVVVRVAAPAGLKSLKVNGQTQSPDAQGLVNIPVTVGSGKTSVIVDAEDAAGSRAHAELALLQRAAAPTAAKAPAVPATPAAPLPPGKRHALVIANQQYQRWTKLDTPRADAQAVAAVLKERFGFQTTVVEDVTRQQLLAALSRLRQQVGPQDQVVVYYAGHGQMDSVTARGYWIPVDGDEKDLSQWVSVIDVTDQLSAMSARHVLVIADSCYSGTLTRSLVPSIDQALTLEQRTGPLKQLSAQRARVAMTSGGLEPVVDGGGVNHSLFARSLLDVLNQVNAPVAAQELHGAVAARFAHLGRRLKVQQQPQYAPIGFAGHEAGDFVFAPI